MRNYKYHGCWKAIGKLRSAQSYERRIRLVFKQIIYFIKYCSSHNSISIVIYIQPVSSIYQRFFCSRFVSVICFVLCSTTNSISCRNPIREYLENNSNSSNSMRDHIIEELVNKYWSDRVPFNCITDTQTQNAQHEQSLIQK